MSNTVDCDLRKPRNVRPEAPTIKALFLPTKLIALANHLHIHGPNDKHLRGRSWRWVATTLAPSGRSAFPTIFVQERNTSKWTGALSVLGRR